MTTAQGKKNGRDLARAQGIREAVSVALSSALKPLTTIALETGLSIEDVYQLLRQAAVHQLSESGDGGSLTISSIAAVTGIPRAEVSKIVKQSAPLSASGRTNEQITNTILAAWREDPRFTDADGHPEKLTMYGRGKSFERLARLHGRGIPTRALLDELKRTDSVTIGPDQIVRQSASVAIERGINPSSVYAVGEHVSELLLTLLHNLRNAERPRLVSKVSSKRIDPEKMPLIRRGLAKLSEQYFSEVQELFNRNSSDGTSPSPATVSLTSFFFESHARIQVAPRRRKNYRRTL